MYNMKIFNSFTPTIPGFIGRLKMRTGFDVHHARVVKVDFLIDAAVVRIYFYQKQIQAYNK